MSVLLRDRPELLDKPVAVAHSGMVGQQHGGHLIGGNSEISSCNYAARKRVLEQVCGWLRREMNARSWWSYRTTFLRMTGQPTIFIPFSAG